MFDPTCWQDWSIFAVAFMGFVFLGLLVREIASGWDAVDAIHDPDPDDDDWR